VFQATIRAAIAGAVVLAAALFLAGWTTGAPTALALLAVAAILLLAGILVWAVRPVRETPSDAQVARFIEEQNPSLDDRLVSAVDLMASDDPSGRTTLAGPMLADADRAASDIDPSTVVSGERLRRSGFQAAAAFLLLAILAFVGRDVAHRSFDALSLVLFPSRVTLDVKPGNARIAVGAPLTIEARLVGNRAPVAAQVLSADADSGSEPGADVAWRPAAMAADPSGAFRLELGAIGGSFKYRVVAGAVTSPVYNITVARPPRVTRIDLEYHYPDALGLAPQTDEDSGDIYAPTGTDVQVHVRTDPPTATGELKLADGQVIALSTPGPTSNSPVSSQADAVLTGRLRVAGDNSYRIALADPGGLTNPGETEYFIRPLLDRPPEVHVRKPARDRGVTMLEEVSIEADAEDDFGIERLEFVYAVRGAAEQVIPLSIPRDATSVTATHLLYLEDLDVQPGDFVSYYVRARDRARGKRSSEGRSDIFFLEVKPFEQEFVMARSTAAGGGSNRTLDDLVAAQKDVIVATWKLDRRTQAANGAKSGEDIRSVAQAETDLKKRVEATSSAFRESNMRDPRQRAPQPGRGQPVTPSPGQLRPEEDAMTAAARAMGKAVTSLTALRTGEAIPPEMEALNHLLKAQADVKRQQVARQQTGNGAGNRSTQDMSSLFDRELKREQETNYETPKSATQQAENTGLADKVKELARRQDELNQRQQDAARLSAEERRRALEKLTRDQTELRQKAEELAKQLEQSQSQGSRGSQGSQSSVGSQSSQGARGSQNPSNGQGGRGGQQMRAVSEEMRNAAGDLQRQNAQQASERGARVSDRLRDLERQLRTGAPDERRRALGEMQLEARQIADAERQVANELNRMSGAQGSRGAQGSQGSVDRDALRRLAGEQQRLADRARRVQDGLDAQAAALAGNPGTTDNQDLQRAIGAAAGDVNRQRLAERMQQSAEQLRAAVAQTDDRQSRDQAAKAAAGQEAVAHDLDSLADKLANAQTPGDDASKRLADQRARAQDLREELNRLTSEIEKLGQQSGATSTQKSQGDTGRSGRGQAGSGGSGGSDLARLRQEYSQKLQQTRELLDQLRREDPSFSQGGPGLTFEGQGMTLSAPGTEAFKQDFAKWDQLRQQATLLLTQAESSLAQRLQAQIARDRLAAGAGDRAPAEYQKQVDEYFKALATQKR